MSFFNEDNKIVWYLEPNKNRPWPDHEPTVAIVVAENAHEARDLAAQHSSIIWYDRYNSSCRPIKNKSFTNPEFIADAVPCQDETLEDTDEYSANVTSMWSMFLDIETSRPLHETDVADLLISYKELAWQ